MADRRWLLEAGRARSNPPLSSRLRPHSYPSPAGTEKIKESQQFEPTGWAEGRALRLERTGETLVTMSWLGFDMLRLHGLTIFANHGNEGLNGAREAAVAAVDKRQLAPEIDALDV